MPELSGGQTARQMLERQLEGLGSLFNAGVRSPNFREWRQATLTCIQRIWPAETSKSERFRRIPFSPPMGRPAEREVREYFERGCGEAGSLLKDYIAEIASGVVPDSGVALAPSATTPPGPGSDEDGFPTVDLPGSPASAARVGSMAPKPRPRLKDLLGFSDASDPDVPDAAPPQRAPAAASGAPPLPRPPAPQPARAPPAMPADTNPGTAPTMPGLDLGFFAPPAPPARGSGAGGSATAHMAGVPPAVPRLVVTGTESAAGPGPPAAQLPEHVAEELLRASTAGSAQQRRAGEERRSTPREARSPVALAVAAIAAEVEALGVPEGHRARAREVLLDLSRRLDAPGLPWETLREAMGFVMAFPGLGRRVVPLLLPYLDRAA